MSPTLDAFLRSWPAAPWLAASLLLSAGIYLRGWRMLRRRDPRRWNSGQLSAYGAFLAVLYLALASPLDTFAGLLLTAHMVQHLLLMMVAPPLLWLASPVFPLLLGLPREIRTVWVMPLLRSRELRLAMARLTHPLAAWGIYVGVTWIWHSRRGYELALQSSAWHVVEHACFFAAALLFWYPVVRPYPSRPRWPRWMLFPYLLLADVQNTALSAWLSLSDHVIYPHYALVPRLASIAALDDQHAAGAIMWVPGSVAFLLPLFVIGVNWLLQPQRSGERSSTRRAGASEQGRAQGLSPLNAAGLPIVTLRHSFDSVNQRRQERFNLLRLPIVRSFAASRRARLALQAVVGLVAAAVIVDGLRGPQVAAMNLAGVLPWIHWRGVIVLGMLIVGNVFCMACPFTLARVWPRGGCPVAVRGRAGCGINGWPWGSWLSFCGVMRR